MRICIISSATQSTPSPTGGLENMVALAAETLLDYGHDVTLVAKTGSQFKGKLIAVDANGYDGEVKLAWEAIRSHNVWAYDVFYDCSHTHHLARIFPDLPVVNHYHDMWQPVHRCAVLCSEGQRALMAPNMPDARVLHNVVKLPTVPANTALTNVGDDYLLWMGAWADFKQPMLAVQVAAKMGVKLVMAGPPPPITISGVDHVGMVTGDAKWRLMANARVYLQLGTHESFGLTTVESMLMGTPVVAMPAGGSLDIVRYGVNGYFVPTYGGDSAQAVADAIDNAWWLERHAIPETVRKFTDVDHYAWKLETMLGQCARGDYW